LLARTSGLTLASKCSAIVLSDPDLYSSYSICVVELSECSVRSVREKIRVG
jgi:hypothetical protein